MRLEREYVLPMWWPTFACETQTLPMRDAPSQAAAEAVSDKLQQSAADQAAKSNSIVALAGVPFPSWLCVGTGTDP